ncbi:MAG TPA: diguanylate cyclase [Aquabacterium sp.]|uniref:GGDEF domain-containing protein n=1 Tax=Aquabacterium sp. TaxID=1872578 RepID=UPI002E34D65E|nr:diguanylate cyclase [Aquabacterium sp.]HEX5371488.1 diguanylate cyclase [Aquabacterium sp.]
MPPTPAQLAKAALLRLAQGQQEPTPDNFRRAYEAECLAQGVRPPEPVPQTTAAVPAAEAGSDDGPRWAELIGRISRGQERSNRQWTAARKKDSLQRVLEGSRHSSTRLLQRLGQLVQSWDSDQADEAAPETGSADLDAPTTVTSATPAIPGIEPGVNTATPAVPSELPASSPDMRQVARALVDTVSTALPGSDAAATEVQQQLQRAVALTWAPASDPQRIGQDLQDACAQARRVIEHRHHLVDQLVGLCQSLTDSLVDLSEDDSWVRGQCEAMQAELSEGLSSRGTRRMQQLLEDTRLRQKVLRAEREAARNGLKQLIHQMLNEIAELGHTTGRFQDNLARYADTIGEANSLESLTGVVREMVEESRAVHGVVSQAQERLHTEHARASELTEKVRQLEDEIRKLSDEVSTDPLTQIANRRGLNRAFEAERARVDRQGALLAVGLLDVDNFKKLNDTLGHQTGDEALKFLARRVGESLRPSDVVARYGGEEFVVLLPDTEVQEGQQILTRLQRQLSAEFFTQDDHKVFITFSAGVTQYRQDEAIEAALDRADLALYEAKRTGKNRTCVA